MKIKTKLYRMKVLHVTVPPSIDAGSFENDIACAVRDGELVGLRDGITVSSDALNDHLQNTSYDDWNGDVLAFLEQLNNRKCVPDEYFFHR